MSVDRETSWEQHGLETFRNNLVRVGMRLNYLMRVFSGSLVFGDMNLRFRYQADNCHSVEGKEYMEWKLTGQ